VAAEIFAMFAHESAHALTTKHYKRHVRRGGAGLYYGMVTFFMDTTDIWMEPRKPRLAVTWAGPFSGFFLGGLASLALLINPAKPWSGLAYQFASFCYLVSILNLNPLLKLDGYYMLMDWLEMPMLRERALRFCQKGLWRKITHKERFSKEEKIYAIFGALAFSYTGFVLFWLGKFLGEIVFNFFQKLMGAEQAVVVTVLLGMILVSLVFWTSLRRLAARVRQMISDGRHKDGTTG
jgi:hypothetical protein